MREVTRLFDIPYYQLEKYPIENALVTKYNNTWTPISSEEYVKKINQVSRSLLRLGVQPHDKIAMVTSNNRTEWHILDMAIYPTIPKEDYIYILNHAEVKYCFASNKELFEKVSSIASEVATLEEVFTFETVEGARGWREMLSL